MPCYNESKKIYGNLLWAHRTFKKFRFSFEILAIDDGSSDDTKFDRLNFYRYWTTNKHILKEIIKNYYIKYFVLRGNNDDYWYGRDYYMRYPTLKGLRVFAFDKK